MTILRIFREKDPEVRLDFVSADVSLDILLRMRDVRACSSAHVQWARKCESAEKFPEESFAHSSHW